MLFKVIVEIVGFVMLVQIMCLNIIVSNLVNVIFVVGIEVDVYYVKKFVFVVIISGDGSGVCVQVMDVIDSNELLCQVYELGYLFVNEQGMVFYLNVNLVVEMIDMLFVLCVFESNVEVLGCVKFM